MEEMTSAARVAPSPGEESLTSGKPDRGDHLSLGLYFFASTGNYDPKSYYEFVIAASVFADRHDFSSVWLPERHFVVFGGFSPNPAVLAGAIAAATKRVGIRAGSVAAPLHHPMRIAEDWAMVDGLSNGRVGLSFASGWHENDFVLATEPHATRKDVMTRRLREVRALWAGETVGFDDPDGNTHSVSLFPTPVRRNPPLWITAAGNPETFELAGRLGVGVMCALFNTTLRQLARKIERYRAAWRAAGHLGRGQVTVMVHSFVSDDRDALARLRPAMRDYLISFGAQSPETSTQDAVLEAAVDSYFDGPSLLGSSERARDALLDLNGADLDEIGALVDFGLPCDLILKNLPNLHRIHVETSNRKQGAQ